MIGPQEQLPPGVMYTRCMTQEQLDECRRALGRELTEREVRALDRIMTQQAMAQHNKSKDEITADLVKIADK